MSEYIKRLAHVALEAHDHSALDGLHVRLQQAEIKST
jgi:hypothetical protein